MRFILFIFCLVLLKNSHSKSWTKEFNGYSSSEKIELSDGSTISHYKNKGNWKDSLETTELKNAMEQF